MMPAGLRCIPIPTITRNGYRESAILDFPYLRGCNRTTLSGDYQRCLGSKENGTPVFGATGSSFGSATIADCNQFWVTLKMGSDLFALPLERLELSFDYNQKTLVLIEHPA
jgi:hypothetical protein